MLSATRAFLRSIPRQPNDFVTVIIPEQIDCRRLPSYPPSEHHGKSGLLREPNVVVTDVPVVGSDDVPLGVDARALIPQRTVTLVFVSSVNDATIRAVNYAQRVSAGLGRSRRRSPTKGIGSRSSGSTGVWALDCKSGAQFRDLTGRYSFRGRPHVAHRPVVNVVISEFLVNKLRHYLLQPGARCRGSSSTIRGTRDHRHGVPYAARNREGSATRGRLGGGVVTWNARRPSRSAVGSV